MGVIPNLNISNNSNDDEDWIYVPSDGSDESDHVLDRFISGRTRNQRKKKSLKPEPTFVALGVKGKSHQKYRRYANANLLNEFGNLINETELDDVSINDFIEQTPSSFSLLMNEIDSDFNLYNKFINCTEDDQKILLQEVIEIELSKIEQNHFVGDTEDCQHCFSRIPPAIRKQLMKKHVPIGLLASIEEKVIKHFRNHPKSIYKTILKNSYHRFLLHICCQYLNLICRSLTTNGQRLSFVHNNRVNFVEPSKLLSEYLNINH